MMTNIEEKIAGEITMADEPGERIRKWRLVFDVSQIELAEAMDIANSVISDYEKGRRKPGTAFVKDIVRSLVEIDEERGGDVVKRFMPSEQEGIIDIGEFSKPADIMEMVDKTEGELMAEQQRDREIFGYTIIDSLKAIASMKSFDYLKIYGWSTERILFFTGIRYGRSPMVAIRASPLTPAAVGYVQPENVDDLTLKLADIEGVPLLKTELDIGTLADRMKDI